MSTLLCLEDDGPDQGHEIESGHLFHFLKLPRIEVHRSAPTKNFVNPGLSA
jgi:hypothetical protein